MEQELIDVNTFKKYMRNNVDIVVDHEDYCGLAVVDNYIDAYGVVDAVPVIRCGECQKSKEAQNQKSGQIVFCRFFETGMNKSDFCSYGEPRTPPAE